MTDFTMYNIRELFQRLISIFAPKPVLLLVCLMAGATLTVADSTKEDMTGGLNRAQALFNGNDINIEGKYKILRFIPYKNGGGIAWVIPLYEGLPVLGNERAFHFQSGGKVKRDKKGNIFIGGHKVLDLESLDIDIEPIVSPEDAMVIFSNRASVIWIPSMTGKPGRKMKGPACAANQETLNADLVLYDALATVGGPPVVVLAWKIICTNREHPYGLIDAKSGTVLYFDSGIRS